MQILFSYVIRSWIKNWQNLYEFSIKSKNIILEINNADEGKQQLDFFYKNKKTVKEIINSSDDDITGNNRRSTYLIN